MPRSLTSWVDPLDAPASLVDAVVLAKRQARSVSSATRSYAPNLLLGTHYGPWPQAECDQNLPPDLLVATPDDIRSIRQQVESEGVGFGVWGVPLDLRSPELAAEHAVAAGYYVANFEPGPSFWSPGDDGASLDAWWRAFWDHIAALGATDALNGNVGVTVIPNDWGLGAFRRSMANLIGGANLVTLETYGGPNTPEYPYPNLWPSPSVASMLPLVGQTPVACILSNLNLASQAAQASRLSSGNLHVWYLR